MSELLIMLAMAGVTLLALRWTRPRVPERCADCGADAWAVWSDGRAVCRDCANALLRGG